jgi:ABC-type xylose transport system permease subunit
MYLLGLAVQWQPIVTGLVLIGAVTVDAISRRGTASGGVAR